MRERRCACLMQANQNHVVILSGNKCSLPPVREEGLFPVSSGKVFSWQSTSLTFPLDSPRALANRGTCLSRSKDRRMQLGENPLGPFRDIPAGSCASRGLPSFGQQVGKWSASETSSKPTALPSRVSALVTTEGFSTCHRRETVHRVQECFPRFCPRRKSAHASCALLSACHHEDFRACRYR